MAGVEAAGMVVAVGMAVVGMVVAVGMVCTACGFWDTELNPTQRRQEFEAASGGIGLA